jgi:TolB-like protein/DNA-binding winged helix-turn-helix (wHTH) protein
MLRPGSCRVFRFGVFEADVQAGELRKSGEKVALQEQPFQVLVSLLEHSGELVWREDLRQQVWPEDTYVEFDHALNTAVKKIRIALGDCANSPEYVETIPKRGYRFLAPVTVEDATASRDTAPVNIRWAWNWLSRSPVLLVLIALVLLCIGLLGMRWSRSLRRSADSRAVIAVMPLEDLTEGGVQSSLCEGITQELIIRIGQAAPDRMSVVPRAASLPYRHTTKTVAEVARELHAQYLVEGTLRGDARRVRVIVEVIRVHDEAGVWSEALDRNVGDSLALESEIAGHISEGIKSAVLGTASAIRAPL